MATVRLQKIIAQAGLASRREAERLIAEGRVQVNGEPMLTPGAKADPLTDSIKVDGKLITRKEPPVYLVLNKPKHVLTTMRDEEGKDRPTVADLLPRGLRRVFPVGRLDFDVEGVLLLTNDGEIANRLAHPKYEIPRVYEAKVKGMPTEAALTRMSDGSWIRGRGQKPLAAHVRIIRGKTEKNAWLRIELREGRQHQVKKMCEAVGHPVIKLLRRAYAGITAKGLPGAHVRTLSHDEVEKLKQMTKIQAAPVKRPVSKAGWAKARVNPKRTARKGAANQKTKEPGKPKSLKKFLLFLLGLSIALAPQAVGAHQKKDARVMNIAHQAEALVNGEKPKNPRLQETHVACTDRIRKASDFLCYDE